MQTDWVQRWHDGNIGFHRSAVHEALLHHWQPRGHSVLVPLCGKSLDLRWLAEQGHEVVGCELAERAVRDFFAEQGFDFDVRDDGPLPAFVCRQLPITLYQGDYFDLHTAPCDALYDRAALVALPPDVRPRYAAHTDALLNERADRVVVTFEYEQAVVAGPPFSVPEDEVARLWPGLECVAQSDVLDDAPPKFRAAGLTRVIERVWRTPND